MKQSTHKILSLSRQKTMLSQYRDHKSLFKKRGFLFSSGARCTVSSLYVIFKAKLNVTAVT